MTRKDYVLIAAALRAVHETSTKAHGAHYALARVAHELSVNLAVENARFDRARFLTACGVQS